MKTFHFAVALFVSAGFAVAATNDITSLVQKGLFEEEANHNLEAAIQEYQSAIGSFDKDRKLVATAIFRLGECYRKQGKTNDAVVQYQRILQEFPDQTTLAKLCAEYAGGTKVADKPDAAQDTKVQDLRASYESLDLKVGEAQRNLEKLSSYTRQQQQDYFTTIERDATVEKLAGELSQAEIKLTETTNNYGPKSIEYQTAKSGVNELNAQIEKRLQALVWSLSEKNESLKMQLMDLKTTLKQAEAAADKSKVTRIASTTAPATSAEDEEIRKIKAMIQNSPDLINAGDTAEGPNQGYTPLRKAAEHGQIAVAEFLLANGANIESGGRFSNETPLILAAKEGHKTMVELLLSKGANVNAADENGETALHEAAKRGFKTVTESLLAHGAKVNAETTAKDYPGNTPLFWVAGTDSSAIAELLIANKADINIKNGAGNPPLYNAAYFGKTEMVRLLLAHQAEVNIRNNKLETPLYEAARRGRTTIVQLLLDHKADVNVTAQEGITPLLAAVPNASLDVVKLLLAHGANVEAQVADDYAITGFRGYRALDYAIYYDRDDLVQLLLDNHADPNAKWTDGKSSFTPLYLAMVGKHPKSGQIVESLLDHGADPNLTCAIARSHEMWTWIPLHAAVQDGNRKMIEALLAHHADVNAKDHVGFTPLLSAVANSKASLDMVKLLLANGANVEAQVADDYDDYRVRGFRAINYAIQSDRFDLLQLLLANHADPNASFRRYGSNQEWRSSTVLIMAIAEDKPNSNEMVEFLLDHGTDPNLAGDQAWTPLHVAVRHGNKKVVEALIAHHANVNAFNKDGNPPIQDAQSSPEIAALLRQAGADENFDRRKHIYYSRDRVQEPYFDKGTNTWNHYTLLELLATIYTRNRDWVGPSFPDFAHVTIRRLLPDKKTEDIKVDANAILQAAAPGKDVPLEWGDIVELPERDHLINESWAGLPNDIKEAFQKCLARQIEVTVKGETSKINLSVSFDTTASLLFRRRYGAAGIVPNAAPGEPAPAPTPLTNAYSFHLNGALQGSGILRASSDTDHIRVKRRSVSGNGEQEAIFSMGTPNEYDAANDLWLQNGDKIEIPERDPNSPGPEPTAPNAFPVNRPLMPPQPMRVPPPSRPLPSRTPVPNNP